MIVVIANKLNDYIASSDLQALDYKCIVGYYPISIFANYIKEHPVDMLVIDLTAIRDIHNEQSWKLFTSLVPADNIYVLHDISNLDKVTTATLITSGIYNIGNSVQEIIGFMEKPNTYASVMRKIKQGPVSYDEDKSGNKIEEYETWTQYQQNMMKEYLRKQRDGEFEEPKKVNVIKDQLLSGFIILPILTFLSTVLFYFLERIIYSATPVGGSLGKALYTKFPNLDFNLLVIVGLFISAIVFSMYYSALNYKIKRKQYTKGKFMIVTMMIYCLIFIADYHLLGVFENWFNKLPEISSVGYLYNDFYTYNYLVCIVAVFTYYFELIVANSKVLVFEKDLNQRFNFFELASTIILFVMVLTPFAYYISRAIAIETGIYKFFEGLYISSNFMVIMTIIGIVVVVLNIIGYLLKLDLNSKVKGVE